jgi:hypothetical protein
MKRAALIFLVLVGCTAPESRDPYHPTRPAEIPSHTCSGAELEWNWKKQRAWDEDRLTVERSESGCVIAIVIKKES